jgi:hypothetical protein
MTFVFKINRGVYLFAAFGKAELINKMVVYATRQKVFVIETFYSYGGSCVLVETVSSSVFCLVSARLLNSSKKRQLCVW